jgi:hypothetical protein
MNWAMGATLTEVPSANGNDPFALSRLMQVRLCFTGGERWGRYYQVSDPGSPLLDLLNVRYLLNRTALDPAALSRSGLEHAASLPGYEIYENPDALPRFFLVGEARPARTLAEARGLVCSSSFRPGEEAVVEGPASFAGAPAEGWVKLTGYAPNRVALEVETKSPAFLVTSEAHYPGWRAFIDGALTPLAMTNVAFRGLPVPTGRHRIEMRFEPRILWWSAAASAAAWLALAMAAFGDNILKQGRWISSST